MLKVLFVESDREVELNCSYWRCRIPSAAFTDHPDWGVESKVVHLTDWVQGRANEETLWADIVMLQRGITPDAIRVLVHWRAKGKVIVLDLDDSYDKLQPGTWAYDYWKQGIIREGATQDSLTAGGVHVKKPILNNTYVGYEPLEYLYAALKLVDALSSPSQLILQDYTRYTQRGMYLPNLIKLSDYPIRSKELSNPPVVGWGGSVTHTETFTESGVIPALRRLAEQRLISVHIIGAINVSMSLQFKHVYEPAVPFSDWQKQLQRFDIGIAPLAGQYDRRRSFLKVAEYGVSGLPVVASRLDPYIEMCAAPGVILVENTAKRWEEALRLVLNNYQLFHERAKDFREDAGVDIDRWGIIWARELKSLYALLIHKGDVV